MKKAILKLVLIAIFIFLAYFIFNGEKNTSLNLSHLPLRSSKINEVHHSSQGKKMLEKYYVSGCAPKLYPTDTFFGLLWYSKDNCLEIPKCYPYQGEWGSILSTHILNQEYYPMPTKLDMVYLSLVEKKFYSIEKDLPTEKMAKLWNQTDKDMNDQLFSHIVVGMAPYGGVALWFVGYKKSILIDWFQGEEINVSMSRFMPSNTMSLEDYCKFYIDNEEQVKNNLLKNGLPDRNLFNNYMKQFCYKYKPDFGKLNKGEFTQDNLAKLDYVEETLFDGTLDKIHENNLLEYHNAGVPQKLSITWHTDKSKYTVYFWFDEKEIFKIYNEFYASGKESKAEFIINIDVEAYKFQLYLYNNETKKECELGTDSFQLKAFKDGYAICESYNYNQPDGAWAW